MKYISKLRNLDSHGYQFGFTYHNNNSYRSWFGFIVTVIVKFGIFIYFCLLIYKIFQRQSYKVTPLEFKRNFYHDKTALTISSDAIDFAVTIGYNGKNKTVEENIMRYVSVDFLKVWTEWATTDEVEENRYASINYRQTYLGSVPCSEDRFGEDTVGKGKNLSESWCPPEDFNFTLRGNEGSTDSEYFSIILMPCNQYHLEKYQPGEVCPTLQESIDIYKDLIVQVNVKQQNFDLNEFGQNPIKKSFDTYLIQISSNITGVRHFAVSQNYAILKDSMLADFIGVKNLTYSSVKSKYGYYPDLSFTNGYMYFMFFQDDSVISIERQAFSLVEAIYKLGGMLGSVNSFAFIFAALFQKNMFYGSLIEALSPYTARTEDSLSISSPIIQAISTMLKQYEQNLMLKMSDQVLSKVLFCCKSRRMRVHEASVQALNKELDLVRYINNMRKLDFIASVLLSKNEAFLARNFKVLAQKKSSSAQKDDKSLIYRLEKVQKVKSKYSAALWKRLQTLTKDLGTSLMHPVTINNMKNRFHMFEKVKISQFRGYEDEFNVAENKQFGSTNRKQRRAFKHHQLNLIDEEESKNNNSALEASKFSVKLERKTRKKK